MKRSDKKNIIYLILLFTLVVLCIILYFYLEPVWVEGSIYTDDPEAQNRLFLFTFIVLGILFIFCGLAGILRFMMDRKIIRVVDFPEIPLIIADERLTGIEIMKFPINLYDDLIKIPSHLYDSITTFEDNFKNSNEDLLEHIQNKLYQFSIKEHKILKDNIYLFERTEEKNKVFYIGETYNHYQRFKNHEKINNYHTVYIITHGSENFQRDIRNKLEFEIINYIKGKYDIDNKMENNYEELNLFDKIIVKTYTSRIRFILDSLLNLDLPSHSIKQNV